MGRSLTFLALALAACGSPYDGVHALPPNTVDGPVVSGPRGAGPATPDGGSAESAGARSLDGTLEVIAGHQSGAMGDITTFDADASRLEAGGPSGDASVRLDSVGTGFWVMSQLEIGGGLGAFRDGVEYQVAAGATDAVPVETGSGAAPVPLSLRGCSGPLMEHYTFDDVACMMRVHTEAHPDGSRRFVYSADFDSGQTLDGWFDYR